MKKTLVLGCMLVSLVGCSSLKSTPYKPALYPEMCGYYDAHFQDNIYEVQFTANSGTEAKRCYDFTLLRGAEVCLEKEYKSFDIISMIDYSSSSIETYSSAYATAIPYTNTAVGSSNNVSVRKNYPCFIFKIKCYKDDTGIYKAGQIKENIIAKYKTKSKSEKRKIEKIDKDLHNMVIMMQENEN